VTEVIAKFRTLGGPALALGAAALLPGGGGL